MNNPVFLGLQPGHPAPGTAAREATRSVVNAELLADQGQEYISSRFASAHRLRLGNEAGMMPSHLYVFFLELASRRIIFTACSEHPGGAWAAQQARNLAWQLHEAEVKPRFLIHDRDGNFPAAFDAVFRAEGLEVIRTPVRAPNANARCERWVSSVRRECLDWLLILNRRHLVLQRRLHTYGCSRSQRFR